MSLLEEIKRRNVLRIAGLYLVGAWLIVQVAGTVLPMFDAPAWLPRTIVVVLAIGFIPALVFAWAFELTPEGLKRDKDVDPSESITPHTGKAIDRIIMVVLALALGVFAFDRFVLSPQRAAAARLQSSKEVAAARKEGHSEALVESYGEKSIAVLPFVDMSAGKDQEYFADGISEELLNLLAQLPQLRVIARTSSFSFKGKEVDVATIAKTLNVAHVLEGSVRKSGDKLRITAQLIRTSDSSHLWSQTYDRKMIDVFQVQDEIAAAVVLQLKIKLLGAAPEAKTTDPEAYALFLQARDRYRQYNAVAFEQAIALYKQALAIDPTYAPAWNGLAVVYFGQIDLDLLAADHGLALAREAIRTALEHDPSFAPAYGTLARFEGFIERDYAAAARHLEQAMALDPTGLEIINDASQVARRLGRLELAIQLGEYQVARDPLSTSGYDALGAAYRWRGQLPESIAAYRKEVSLSPDAAWAHFVLGSVLLQTGDAEAALAEFRKEPSESFRLTGLAMAYQTLGRKAASDAALAELMKKYMETKPYFIAAAMAYRGDIDRAFEMLDKAERNHDLELGSLAVYPAFATMHEDPRWLPLLRRLGLAPEQLAGIKFDVKLPQ